MTAAGANGPAHRSGWSTPADVRAEVARRWERGQLLAEVAEPAGTFPLRVGLKRPTSAELGARFEDVRAWAAALSGIAHARVELRDVNHRQIGANAVPVALWLDSVEVAAALIGKSRDLQRFRALCELTRSRFPALVPFLVRRPIDALAEAEAWPRLLDVVGWLAHNQRPGIYLRQVDLPGVHTKFVEQHQRTLAALLDLALPAGAIDERFGRADFARRYGFRPRPRLVRFRSLDHRIRRVVGELDGDYLLTAADFARIEPPRRVFVTENEINFLAFPPVEGSMVMFGAGSGFEHLAEVCWLADVPVHYWGDLDTHGFAILDQLRRQVHHVTSLLMDRTTLLAHRDFWGREEKPTRRDLPLLTADELAVYDDLRDNRLQPNLRLEQERIRFGVVRSAVENAAAAG